MVNALQLPLKQLICKARVLCVDDRHPLVPIQSIAPAVSNTPKASVSINAADEVSKTPQLEPGSQVVAKSDTGNILPVQTDGLVPQQNEGISVPGTPAGRHFNSKTPPYVLIPYTPFQTCVHGGEPSTENT